MSDQQKPLVDRETFDRYVQYTPTTSEVRRSASDYRPPITADEFDRWLAAHDAEVREAERERAALHAEEGYRMEERCDDIAHRIRSGEPAEISARPRVVAEEPDVADLRAARAETWDEAISAVFAWWSTPENARPAAIVNPYGLGVPVTQEGTET